jgi:hypothetical protein
MQRVIFRANQSLQSVIANEHNRRTTLTEWFTYNTYNTDGRHLTYLNFPKEFVWYQDGKYWQRRRKPGARSIGRLAYIHPSSGDVFYLRILLCHQKGSTSFTNIRTVDDHVHVTYRGACKALGLLANDQEWNIALQEASLSATASEMRTLFCQMLIFCEVARPAALLQSHTDSMSEDIPLILSGMLHMRDIHVNPDDLHGGLMCELEAILNSYGRSVTEFGMELPSAEFLKILTNRAIMEERSYDRELLAAESASLVGRLNRDQQLIFDEVIHAVNTHQQKLIFLYGHGGTGKTYVWKAIISTLRSNGKIVLAVASSGIASLLLPSGRTAHTKFKIPLDLTDESVCSIKKNATGRFNKRNRPYRLG